MRRVLKDIWPHWPLVELAVISNVLYQHISVTDILNVYSSGKCQRTVLMIRNIVNGLALPNKGQVNSQAKVGVDVRAIVRKSIKTTCNYFSQLRIKTSLQTTASMFVI